MYQLMFWEALLHQTILALSRTHAGALTPRTQGLEAAREEQNKKRGFRLSCAHSRWVLISNTDCAQSVPAE